MNELIFGLWHCAMILYACEEEECRSSIVKAACRLEKKCSFDKGDILDESMQKWRFPRDLMGLFYIIEETCGKTAP